MQAISPRRFAARGRRSVSALRRHRPQLILRRNPERLCAAVCSIGLGDRVLLQVQLDRSTATRSLLHGAAALGGSSLLVPSAQAGFGAYVPGLGAASTGTGGVVYAQPLDTTPLSANPAMAGWLGTRVDASLEYDGAYSHSGIHDNLFGRDAHYVSDARHFFFPRLGGVTSLTDSVSVGASMFLAGFASHYDDSPFARFGGADESRVALTQLGVSFVASYRFLPEQSLGISLNLSYDSLKAKGVEALSAASESPDHFSDNGSDGAPGVGFSIGWYGRLRPWLAAGFGYRSKTFAQRKIDQYSGLLPGQGTLEFPAMFGGGLCLTPLRNFDTIFEMQRVLYEDEPTFSNSLSNIRQHRFGEDEGPGFGWVNQTIYRLGFSYSPDPRLTLRAGYSRANEQMPSSETLFGMFAPNTSVSHYSLGVVWSADSLWEYSGSLAYAPVKQQRGEDSIPPIVGGGEADVKIRSTIVSIAVSRRFDW